MTIASATNKHRYAGTGAQVVFPYTFRAWSASDIQVIHRSTAGVETPLTLGTDYTVSGVGSDDGGNVTLIGDYAAAPPASGEFLLVKRVLPLLQETDLVENAATPAAVFESAFDRITAILQQMQEQVDRSIKVAATEEDPIFSAADLRNSIGDTAAAVIAAGQAIAAASQVTAQAAQVSADRVSCDADAVIAAEAQAVAVSAASLAQGYATSAAANSAAPAFSLDTPYSFPDVTAYADGCTYRCIGVDVMGETPDTSVNFVRLTTRANEFFDLDDNGDLMPSTIPGYSAEFDTDANGDIQPR